MTERSSNPYAASSPEIDKAIRECTDSNELQQLLAQLMAARGVRTRGTDGTFDSTHDAEITPAASSPLPTASADARLFRVIYPSGNNRFELYGDTEESLDAQETAIRAMYQR